MDSDLSNPLISAVMIVYNGEQFIAKAIDSVLSQTYKNFELLIWNDGSTDGTENIIKLKSNGDSRIKYFKSDVNRGLSFSRNKIIKEANGNFIAVTDADDISLPIRFETQIKFLQKNTQISVVGSTVKLIDVNGKERGVWQYPLRDEEIKTGLSNACVIANPSSMFTIEVFKKVNGYDENLTFCEDWDFFYRAVPYFNFSNYAEPLVLYRVHESSMSKNNLVRTIIYSVCLNNKLEGKYLGYNLKELLNEFPKLKHELVKKTIKFYIYWIDTYCKLGYKKLSETLFFNVKSNLFELFEMSDKKIFLKNCLSIYSNDGNIKMIFVALINYLKR